MFNHLIDFLSKYDLVPIMQDLVANALALFSITLAIWGIIIATGASIRTSNMSHVDKVVQTKILKESISGMLFASILFSIIALMALISSITKSNLLALINLFLFIYAIFHLVFMLMRLSKILQIP